MCSAAVGAGGNEGTGLPRYHTVHEADANEVEIAINFEFLRAIEHMIDPHMLLTPSDVILVFTDLIVEARKLQRLDERGDPQNVAHLGFSIKDLLIHLPVQL
jgi:hypothetical protein